MWCRARGAAAVLGKRARGGGGRISTLLGRRLSECV